MSESLIKDAQSAAVEAKGLRSFVVKHNGEADTVQAERFTMSNEFTSFHVGGNITAVYRYSKKDDFSIKEIK